MHQNYIPDINKFKLAGPPDWWLRKLWDFDNSLVVVPSRQDYVYRLAQRRKPNLPAKIVNDILWQDSDTQMLARYGLIPVTSILATANWSNPFMFEELRRRAPWRQFASTEDAIAAVEAQDRQEELATQAAIDERNEAIAKDGWGLYLKKIGVRSHMYIPKTPKDKAPKVGPRAPLIKIAK